MYIKDCFILVKGLSDSGKAYSIVIKKDERDDNKSGKILHWESKNRLNKAVGLNSSQAISNNVLLRCDIVLYKNDEYQLMLSYKNCRFVNSKQTKSKEANNNVDDETPF